LPASLIVVSGLRKDFLYLPRRGHVIVASELDKNLSFQSAPRDKREYFTLQVLAPPFESSSCVVDI